MTVPSSPSGHFRGITIRQPWATCIASGPKRIENRPRHWSWRGWLLLHAGLQIDRAALDLPPVARTIQGRDLPTGAVIGVARLSGCHHDPAGAPPCGTWAEPGCWHLELTDVHELARPVPARGQLGPWRPTDELVARVRQQLPRLPLP
ncbi:hypothetical protein B591_31118 (plasmid) [Streptomyces sp. GBA 94-10 4N24]|uniref:hypothetical protein n=1 Tax=Streptomyces sp. GBA 94-10 4N24 TaxID=1218177 RepID=UPI0003C2C16F|nr:hypothetical protein [Streptomyces sp. GBA 94-10 4N24]ESP95743.1 hypothetical protein B591_31118 [Streptomyces sp. GBA 94-10 4N24]UZN63203.1 hypothetical protein B591N_31118 [Streptomyces sp. GBA 94-10 4N24]